MRPSVLPENRRRAGALLRNRLGLTRVSAKPRLDFRKRRLAPDGGVIPTSDRRGVRNGFSERTGRMHVISRKRIREFGADHADAVEPLDRWYRIAKKATWANFAEVRTDFGSADQV